LYDLKSDPEESNNLYGKKPKVEEELIRLFSNAIKKGRTRPGAPQANYSTFFSGRNWDPLAVFQTVQ
jgi:hypothetical protein